MSGDADPVWHATAVAVDGRGLLIRGASGTGKSSLALQMIGQGATLVADDRTILTRAPDGVRLSPPDAIAGLIEARGLGILRTPWTEARLHAVLELDHIEKARLPPRRSMEILGNIIELLHRSTDASFPAALMLYLSSGRAEEA